MKHEKQIPSAAYHAAWEILSKTNNMHVAYACKLLVKNYSENLLLEENIINFVLDEYQKTLTNGVTTKAWRFLEKPRRSD